MQGVVIFKDPERLVTIKLTVHLVTVCFFYQFRLEDAITALKSIYLQQRPSVSSLFLCQVSSQSLQPRPQTTPSFNVACRVGLGMRPLYVCTSEAGDYLPCSSCVEQVLVTLTTLLIMIEKTLVCSLTCCCINDLLECKINVYTMTQSDNNHNVRILFV